MATEAVNTASAAGCSHRPHSRDPPLRFVAVRLTVAATLAANPVNERQTLGE